MRVDDGGGPGKRGGPFTPRPLNLEFGTPPAHKAAIWAQRKAEHKTPPRVASLTREIGGLAKQLKKGGTDADSIREMVSEIAVVDRFEHLDCLSVQVLERVRRALEKYLAIMESAVPIEHGKREYHFFSPYKIRNMKLTARYHCFYFAHDNSKFKRTKFGFEPAASQKINSDEVREILRDQGYSSKFYKRKAVTMVSAFKKY